LVASHRTVEHAPFAAQVVVVAAASLLDIVHA